ncbi:hypothetical protein BJF83_01800 [Nocardiopsis sp. CNR-923]|nr:hypothetical protein BJF83_01800 [Nocardiopsis sp. CNR-923]
MVAPRAHDITRNENMSTKIDGWLLDILACPQSQAPLRHDPETDELVCDESGLAYPIRDGIPVLLVDEARKIG